MEDENIEEDGQRDGHTLVVLCFSSIQMCGDKNDDVDDDDEEGEEGRKSVLLSLFRQSVSIILSLIATLPRFLLRLWLWMSASFSLIFFRTPNTQGAPPQYCHVSSNAGSVCM